MDSVRRFSARVENYVKYRPSYPAQVLDLLASECDLKSGSPVADIGAGTGIFTRLLLERGYRVFSVEPNDEMRAVAEKDFQGDPNFSSIPGTAEGTGLESGSIRLVTMAQAFHWFDHPKFRIECLRILQPGGWASILWNNRQTGSTPFLAEYNRLLQTLGTDYERVDHNLVSKETIRDFYGGDHFGYHTFPNQQVFDWEGFLGRALSSSYVPMPGHPNYEPLVTGLREIFDAHAVDGKVSFDYDTEVYLGKVL